MTDEQRVQVDSGLCLASLLCKAQDMVCECHKYHAFTLYACSYMKKIMHRMCEIIDTVNDPLWLFHVLNNYYGISTYVSLVFTLINSNQRIWYVIVVT